jgi:hypothetical protein
MAPWGWIAGGYGVLLTLTAIGLSGVSKRPLAAVACAAYALIALGAATLSAFWVHLVVPGALLLIGYWLSGFFFGTPQPWLEHWLLASDRRVFQILRADHALAAAPGLVLEILEGSYAADYIVVGAGVLIAAPHGTAAVSYYWTVVLGAELACYAALPFLRSRPPRTLEPAGVIARRAPRLRALNVAILDRASVQANTLPSGHVAGALAAALAVMAVSATAGSILMVMAFLIAASAVAGRYHYAVDCVLGALVAVAAAGVVSLAV